MRRNGYFKIDETEAHAQIIFPIAFARGLTAVGVARRMVAAGILGKMQYIASTGWVIEPEKLEAI